jgi:hypothetical protein
MAGGIALGALGLALAGFGLRATERARPADLVGSLAAAVGVALALAGALGIAVPGLFG